MSGYKHWNTVELVILGGGAVGKSAITVRFVSNHFVQIYDPTIEDSYRTSKCINGEAFIISILDTAGQDEYSALRDTYIRQGEGFILVFALNSPQTINDISSLRDSIFMILDKDKTEYIPIFLCANKKDLETRSVTTEEVKNLATDWKCNFKEVSAKTGEGVDEMFVEFVKEIIEHRDRNAIQVDESTAIRKRSDSKLKCRLF